MAAYICKGYLRSERGKMLRIREESLVAEGESAAGRGAEHFLRINHFDFRMGPGYQRHQAARLRFFGEPVGGATPSGQSSVEGAKRRAKARRGAINRCAYDALDRIGRSYYPASDR